MINNRKIDQSLSFLMSRWDALQKACRPINSVFARHTHCDGMRTHLIVRYDKLTVDFIVGFFGQLKQ